MLTSGTLICQLPRQKGRCWDLILLTHAVYKTILFTKVFFGKSINLLRLRILHVAKLLTRFSFAFGRCRIFWIMEIHQSIFKEIHCQDAYARASSNFRGERNQKVNKSIKTCTLANIQLSSMLHSHSFLKRNNLKK